MKKSYILRTLGCKANFYDSQLIEAELQKRGWVPRTQQERKEASAVEDSVLCIVNSCTVTDEADRQTRKMAARLARDYPGARVVVTGCAAEVDPERLTHSKGIHYIIGNRDKPKLVELILEKISAEPPSLAAEDEVGGVILGSAAGYGEILSRHPMDREWPEVDRAFLPPPMNLRGHSEKTRVFLKIQEGCNSFCTYCIIPYGRGPSRSIRPGEIVRQVRELVAEGVKEVVITGTNIGDYGTDWAEKPQLEALLEALLGETGLTRLRVSSLDPTEISPGLLALMERDPRFCPHFHVSLQSPHSRILRLMKRRYGFDEVKACLERLQRIPTPGLAGGVFVGMDLITGFPGEGAEEYEQTREALESLPWTRLHVFPYSEREGTPATRLSGSVPREERLSRSRALNDLSLKRLVAHYEQAMAACRSENRKLTQVLLERIPAGPKPCVGGYTPNYLRVLIPMENLQGRSIEENQLVEVEPVELRVDSQGGDVAIVGRLI